LVAVGGIAQSKEGKKFIDSIFILDLVNGSKWERLTVSLPESAASVGLFQQSEEKIMIFGGYNQTNAKNGT
jgi:N-acetylneuraminic acid mutarotase